MEILASTPVTATTFWGALCIIGVIGGLIGIIMCLADGVEFGAAICASIMLFSIIMSAIFGISAPTGEMNYTVEITDPSKYQTLIEEGYSFKRVYDSREIYTITGEPLE